MHESLFFPHFQKLLPETEPLENQRTAEQKRKKQNRNQQSPAPVQKQKRQNNQSRQNDPAEKPREKTVFRAGDSRNGKRSGLEPFRQFPELSPIAQSAVPVYL